MTGRSVTVRDDGRLEFGRWTLDRVDDRCHQRPVVGPNGEEFLVVTEGFHGLAYPETFAFILTDRPAVARSGRPDRISCRQLHYEVRTFLLDGGNADDMVRTVESWLKSASITQACDHWFYSGYLGNDGDELSALAKEFEKMITSRSGVSMTWAVRAGADPGFFERAWRTSRSHAALMSFAFWLNRPRPEIIRESEGKQFPNRMPTFYARFDDGRILPCDLASLDEMRDRLGPAPTFREILSTRTAK